MEACHYLVILEVFLHLRTFTSDVQLRRKYQFFLSGPQLIRTNVTGSYFYQCLVSRSVDNFSIDGVIYSGHAILFNICLLWQPTRYKRLC